jgi:hypothetical protein
MTTTNVPKMDLTKMDASDIRRNSTYNLKTKVLKAYGVVVPFIPCYRCNATGLVTLGTGNLSGSGRCPLCKGDKRLTPELIEAGIRFDESRRREAETARIAAFTDFATILKKAASKEQQPTAA